MVTTQEWNVKSQEQEGLKVAIKALRHVNTLPRKRKGDPVIIHFCFALHQLNTPSSHR